MGTIEIGSLMETLLWVRNKRVGKPRALCAFVFPFLEYIKVYGKSSALGKRMR